MYERDYAYTRRLEDRTVEEVANELRVALGTEGFGVLTEIDVQATLKSKLGLNEKPFLILGACNPTLAHRALHLEPALGVFLPCNVSVFEGEDGATWVQAVKPRAMFSMVDNPGIETIADEVGDGLERVIEGL